MPTILTSMIHQTSCPKPSSVGWSRVASTFMRSLALGGAESRTTSPGPEPRSLRISLPGDLIGSQTTPVGHGGDPRRGRLTQPVVR